MKKGYRKIFFDIGFILSPLLLFPFKTLVLGIGKIIMNEKMSRESIDVIKDTIRNIPLNKQWIIIIVLIFLFYYNLRARNGYIDFNFGNEYMEYPYFIFYLAGKVLGIKSIDLKLVPIYLQARLIINNTFKEIKYQDDLEDVDSEAISSFSHGEDGNQELTLVLEDTFFIKEKQLGSHLNKTNILRITKGNLIENVRNYSTHFIKEIDSNIFKLEGKYKIINICATTNTKHTYKLVSNNFKKGNRGDAEKLIVYQQSRDNDRVFEKGYEIRL